MNRTLLEKLRSELGNLSAEEGLKLMSEKFAGKTVFSTSFGMEDQVITHWIGNGKMNIRIFTIDTGRLFQETYDVHDLTRKKYDVRIDTYYPQTASVENLLNTKGPNSFYESIENRKECCYIRKVEPLRRALEGAAVWITGLRADQSQNRNTMNLLEWDEQYQLIKYNPMLYWSLPVLTSYAEHFRIPVNTLHKKNYPSIGCAPCTRAVLRGEDIRAGRWWWEASGKECGLHARK